MKTHLKISGHLMSSNEQENKIEENEKIKKEQNDKDKDKDIDYLKNSVNSKQIKETSDDLSLKIRSMNIEISKCLKKFETYEYNYLIDIENIAIGQSSIKNCLDGEQLNFYFFWTLNSLFGMLLSIICYIFYFKNINNIKSTLNTDIISIFSICLLNDFIFYLAIIKIIISFVYKEIISIIKDKMLNDIYSIKSRYFEQLIFKKIPNNNDLIRIFNKSTLSIVIRIGISILLLPLFFYYMRKSKNEVSCYVEISNTSYCYNFQFFKEIGLVSKNHGNITKSFNKISEMFDILFSFLKITNENLLFSNLNNAESNQKFKFTENRCLSQFHFINEIDYQGENFYPKSKDITKNIAISKASTFSYFYSISINKKVDNSSVNDSKGAKWNAIKINQELMKLIHSYYDFSSVKSNDKNILINSIIDKVITCLKIKNSKLEGTSSMDFCLFFIKDYDTLKNINLEEITLNSKQNRSNEKIEINEDERNLSIDQTNDINVVVKLTVKTNNKISNEHYFKEIKRISQSVESSNIIYKSNISNSNKLFNEDEHKMNITFKLIAYSIVFILVILKFINGILVNI